MINQNIIFLKEDPRFPQMSFLLLLEIQKTLYHIQHQLIYITKHFFLVIKQNLNFVMKNSYRDFSTPNACLISNISNKNK